MAKTIAGLINKDYAPLDILKYILEHDDKYAELEEDSWNEGKLSYINFNSLSGDGCTIMIITNNMNSLYAFVLLAVASYFIEMVYRLITCRKLLKLVK